MGNFTCRQTGNHSKTLSYGYVSDEKNFWPLWNIRDHIPLKYVTVQVIWALCDHKLLFKEAIRIV